MGVSLVFREERQGECLFLLCSKDLEEEGEDVDDV